MSRWFKNPKKEVVVNLPYSFWFREGCSTIIFNIIGHFRKPDYWDIRFYLSIPLIPVWLLIAPVACLLIKSHKLKDIDNCNGFAISSDRNADIFRELNK